MIAPFWFGDYANKGPRPKDVMLVVAKGPFFIQINGGKWVLLPFFAPVSCSQHLPLNTLALVCFVLEGNGLFTNLCRDSFFKPTFAVRALMFFSISSSLQPDPLLRAVPRLRSI